MNTIETQLELEFDEQPTYKIAELAVASTAMLTMSQQRNVTFHGPHGETIGELNWTNGPMTFKGDADASGQMFFDVVIKQYAKWTGTEPTGWKS